MKSLIFFLFLILQFSTGLDISVPWAPFNYSSFDYGAISENQKVAVFYRVNQSSQMVTIGIAAKNYGWLGIGLSEHGGMKGADIALFYKKQDSGKLVLEDRFAKDSQEPLLDSIQNIKLIMGWQELNGTFGGGAYSGPVTAFLFERPLRHCSDSNGLDLSQQQDSEFFMDKTQFFIWAYGEGTNTFGYHGMSNRGSIAFNSFDTGSDANWIPGDAKQLTIQMPNVTVPAGSTTYCFSYRALPQDITYYAVAEEAIVSSPRVHHIILYTCPPPDQAIPTFPDQKSDFCLPKYRSSVCRALFVLWGVGGDPRILPPDLARPFGKSQPTKYVLLEIHYDNVQSSFVDQSGFRISYITSPRKYNLGILTVGSTEASINLPAQRTNVSISNLCPSAYTNSLIPSGPGIFITAVSFHMHARGIRAYSAIKRDNLVEYKTSIIHYSFENQVTQLLATPMNLQQGDSMSTTCYFDTMGDSSNVKGGFGSGEEMCYAFMEYYPMVPSLDGCIGYTIADPKIPLMEPGDCKYPNNNDQIYNNNTIVNPRTSKSSKVEPFSMLVSFIIMVILVTR